MICVLCVWSHCWTFTRQILSQKILIKNWDSVPLLGQNPNFCQFFLMDFLHVHTGVQILQKVISIIMWGNDFADVTLACKYGGVFRLTKSSTLRAALDRPQNKSVKICRNKNTKCPIDAHCHRHCRKDREKAIEAKIKEMARGKKMQCSLASRRQRKLRNLRNQRFFKNT